MTDERKSESLKTAHSVALEWFKIHADQRLKVFNFFIIIAGFSIGGFFTALQARNPIAASVIGFALACVSYCFYQLDRRTRQLIHISEHVLNISLERLARELNIDAINLVRLSDQKGSVWSYRQVFNAIFCLFGGLGVMGVLLPWIQR
ncbi:MAG TPA: hypothetical protein VF744_02715 [Beijerinckiaceae bacterium]|jgi:hypothetical protein